MMKKIAYTSIFILLIFTYLKYFIKTDSLVKVFPEEYIGTYIETSDEIILNEKEPCKFILTNKSFKLGRGSEVFEFGKVIKIYKVTDHEYYFLDQRNEPYFIDKINKSGTFFSIYNKYCYTNSTGDDDVCERLLLGERFYKNK